MSDKTYRTYKLSRTYKSLDFFIFWMYICKLKMKTHDTKDSPLSILFSIDLGTWLAGRIFRNSYGSKFQKTWAILGKDVHSNLTKMSLTEDELLLNIYTKLLFLWHKPYPDFTASATSLKREVGFKKWLIWTSLSASEIPNPVPWWNFKVTQVT